METRTFTEHKIPIVKISSVPNPDGFKRWLKGQTCPLVEDDSNPWDWAYSDDYERFANNLPIID